MPIHYGTTADVSKQLSVDDFGKLPQHKQSEFSWTSFFRIMIIVAEIGLSLVAPGAGTLIGLGAQIGIGLGAAVANLGVSAAEGQISGISTGIDFASAFIPAAGAIKEGIKVGKVIKGFTAAEISEKVMGKAITKETAKATKSFEKTTAQAEYAISKIKNKLQNAETNLEFERDFYGTASVAGRTEKAKQKMIAFAQRLANKELNKNDKAMIELYTKQYQIGFDKSIGHVMDNLADYRNIMTGVTKLEKMQAQVENWGSKLAIVQHALKVVTEKYGTSLAELEKYMAEMTEVFKEASTWGIGKRLLRGDFVKNVVNKLSSGEQARLFSNTFVSKELNNFLTFETNKLSYFGKIKNAFSTERAITRSAINTTLSQMTEEDRGLFKALFNRIVYHTNVVSSVGQTSSRGAKQLKSIDSWLGDADIIMSKISPHGQKIIFDNLKSNNLESIFKIFSKAGEPSKLNQWIKYLGSSDFNQRWVQKLQLIDANDAGRALPELAYQRVKNRFLNNRMKAEIEKFEKAFEGKAGRIIKGIEESEEGNIRINGRYLSNIRILKKSPKGGNICLVTFNKINTNAKSSVSKNHGGKPPVLIEATDKDLNALSNYGEEYWWAYGKRKGWWISRGGRRIGSNLASISTAAHLFLGFAPIPVLRNVLSIISNWVENINSLAKGNYFNEWLPKFERAFLRTSVNRTLRFTSRYLIGETFIRKMGSQLDEKVNSALSEEISKNISGKLSESAGRLNEIQFASLYSKTFQRSLRFAQSQALRAKSEGAKWLGRELQRFTSATISSFESKDKNGYLKFSAPTAEQFMKKIATASVTSFKGSVMRKSNRIVKNRQKSGQFGAVNTGKQLIASKRNLGQISRIYSAVTPSGSVPQLRSLTRFK